MEIIQFGYIHSLEHQSFCSKSTRIPTRGQVPISAPCSSLAREEHSCAACNGFINRNLTEQVPKTFGRFYAAGYLCNPFAGKQPLRLLSSRPRWSRGLRRIPFTDESRVRFPYAVQRYIVNQIVTC
jgi:hypothetical protein